MNHRELQSCPPFLLCLKEESMQTAERLLQMPAAVHDRATSCERSPKVKPTARASVPLGVLVLKTAPARYDFPLHLAYLRLSSLWQGLYLKSCQVLALGSAEALLRHQLSRATQDEHPTALPKLEDISYAAARRRPVSAAKTLQGRMELRGTDTNAPQLNSSLLHVLLGNTLRMAASSSLPRGYSAAK